MTSVPPDRRRWHCPTCGKTYLIPGSADDPLACPSCTGSPQSTGSKSVRRPQEPAAMQPEFSTKRGNPAWTPVTVTAWVIGSFLGLASLGALAELKTMLAAPLLLAAAFLVLPPGWALISSRWPTVLPVGTLLRSVSAILAVMILGALAPSDDLTVKEEPGSTTTVNTMAQHDTLPQQPSKSQPAPLPEYTIINQDVFLAFKRSLDIRLIEKVSEDELTAIALRLKASDSKSYDRTFICYYLPGMQVGAGAWATTHFDPSLKVRFLRDPVEQGSQRRKVHNTSQASPLVCDDFNLVTKITGAVLELSVKTDLPDDTIVMVDVSRTYKRKNNRTDYPVRYFGEKSTIGKWKSPRRISIDSDKWTRAFTAKQRLLIAAEIGGHGVASISNSISVSMVVPVFQTNPRFGEQNSNLIGKAVSKSVTRPRVVEDSDTIDYPLNSSPVGQSPSRSVNHLDLEQGDTFTVSAKTPLMPSHSPADPIAAIQQVKYIPRGGSFKVLGLVKKRTRPWYNVTAWDTKGQQIGTGWINSIVLREQDLRPLDVGTRTPSPKEATSPKAPKDKGRGDAKKQKVAANRLLLAKTLIRKGKKASGKKRLIDVVRQYRGTEAAKEAEKLLEKMGVPRSVYKSPN